MSTLVSSEWLEDRPLVDLASVTSSHLLVVVPHPDDEALSTGGLIAWHLRQPANRIDVICVTDGEQAYPGAVDPRILGPIRVDEQARSLATLGVGGPSTHRLGIPDGGVEQHLDALCCEIDRLAEETSTVVAPWCGDWHADHVAVGLAARRVARHRSLPLLGGLFWAYHHRRPASLADHALSVLHMDADLRRTKRAAIAAHRSQLEADPPSEPILPPAALIPALWARELFVIGRTTGPGEHP